MSSYQWDASSDLIPQQRLIAPQPLSTTAGVAARLVENQATCSLISTD